MGNILFAGWGRKIKTLNFLIAQRPKNVQKNGNEKHAKNATLELRKKGNC